MGSENLAASMGTRGLPGLQGPSGADDQSRCNPNLSSLELDDTAPNIGNGAGGRPYPASGGIRKNGGANATVHGVVAQPPGTCLTFVNSSTTGTLTIADNSASTGIAGHRFANPDNQPLVLSRNEVATYKWDQTIGQWQLYHLARLDAPPADFWRATATTDLPGTATPAGTGNLPDGVNDHQGDIHHQGKIMVGAGQALAGQDPNSWRTPVALIDGNRWNQLRTGTDRRNTEDGLYVTQNIAAGSIDIIRPDTTFGGATQPKHFLGHLNQTAGFAFGWRTIKQVGTSHDMVLALSGAGGQFGVHWAGHNGTAPGAFFNWCQPAALANGQGWNHRYWANTAAAAAVEAGDIIRRGIPGHGSGLGIERFWQQKDHAGAFRNAMRLYPSPVPAAFTLDVNPGNAVYDNLLSLYGDPAAVGMFSLGIRGSTLAYFNGALNRWHSFFAAQSDTVPIIQFLKDSSNRSRVRIPAIPAGATQPAGLGSGDLWRNTSDNTVRIVP